MFIFGAVAVGMFHMPWLGVRLALAHYIGALGVGLLFRFYGARSAPAGATRTESARPSGSVFARAGLRLIQAQAEDGRPLGQVLGDAVTDSVKTLLMKSVSETRSISTRAL